MAILKAIGCGVLALFISIIVLDFIDPVLSKMKGLPRTKDGKRPMVISQRLSDAITLLIAAGAAFASYYGTESVVGIYHRISPLLGVSLVVFGAILFGRKGVPYIKEYFTTSGDERAERRQTKHEKAQPDYPERCATARRLIARASGMQDRFNNEATQREALLHSQTYLARAAQIEAAYEDPNDPLCSTGRCLEMAQFAGRHLQDMKEVANHGAGELALLLDRMHRYEYEVLRIARAVRDGRMASEIQEKDAKQQQQAAAERREAELEAQALEEREQKERAKRKDELLVLAEALAGKAATLQAALQLVDNVQGVNPEEKASMRDTIRKKYDEDGTRIKRRAGLVD